MKNFTIISYSSSYRDKLFAYIKKTNPDKCEKYLEYCIEKLSDAFPSLIVLNEFDEIVGCHLFFLTKALTKGEEKTIAWGHDTFLDEDYRSSAGLDFVLAISNVGGGLGIGLSDVNRKIQKKLKRTVWLDNVYNYFLIDYFFPLSVLNKVLHVQLKPLKKHDFIKSKIIFRIVKDAEEIKVPNNGYWYGDSIDLDLVRNTDFIDYRFISNVVFNYTVYEYHNNKGDTCYFVVRPILYRGIPTVLLVDYRCYGSPDLMKCIIGAVKKIARKNHIGHILTTGGMKDVEDVLNSPFCIKRQAECVIDKSLKLQSTDYISITPADSDVDFNR